MATAPLLVPAFQFVSPLKFENGLSIEKVRFHDSADIRRQIVDQDSGEVGRIEKQERYVDLGGLRCVLVEFKFDLQRIE